MRQTFRPGEFTDREDSSDRVMPGVVEELDSDRNPRSETIRPEAIRPEAIHSEAIRPEAIRTKAVRPEAGQRHETA